MAELPPDTADHSDAVYREAARITGNLRLAGLEEYREAILEAALKHDWGKAHPVMQETLHNSNSWTELLAKQERGNAKRAHGRKHFRHELASALAMLAAGDSDLAAYMAAAHHGRIRVSIRSMPGDVRENGETRVRGIDHGEHLPECEIASGVRVPRVRLSLSVMRTGATQEYGISWTERAIRLRDEIGPFRLAYLEMLLRAADERASRSPEEALCTR